MFDNEVKSMRSSGSRSSRTTHPKRIERQAGAKVRRELYEKLTTQQKLEKLNLYAGKTGGMRQRAKLEAKLAAENLAVVTKAQKKTKKD